jgi:hypothetical protein
VTDIYIFERFAALIVVFSKPLPDGFAVTLPLEKGKGRGWG